MREEGSRCGAWLWSTIRLVSSRQSRGTALSCASDWLASVQNRDAAYKPLSQEKNGTNLMKTVLRILEKCGFDFAAL